MTVTRSSSGALVSTTAPFTLQLATNKSINPGATDSYTVTVEFSVATTATSAVLDCQLVSGEQGTGTLNTATVTHDGQTIKDDACAPVPKLEIVKEVVSIDVDAEGAGSVSYLVKVTNTGPVSTTFDLVDTPTFGDGVTITRMSSGTKVVKNAPFSLELAKGQPIEPTITLGFEVTVQFIVSSDIAEEAQDCELAQNESGTGAFNTATVTFDGQSRDATACDEVPFGGGAGGGGGQPPTDMLLPSTALTADEGGNPLDDTTSWALWVLLTASLILSGAWVIRRQRFAEI